MMPNDERQEVAKVLDQMAKAQEERTRQLAALADEMEALNAELQRTRPLDATDAQRADWRARLDRVIAGMSRLLDVCHVERPTTSVGPVGRGGVGP